MFKMVTGNNGRSVYCGVVTRTMSGERPAIELKGSDWIYEEKRSEERLIQMLVGCDAVESSKKIKAGDTIITTLLPDRKIENFGTAEEIAKVGEAVRIKNENGKEKVILIGVVRGLRWNDKHNKLSVSFCNVKDVEGNYLGYASKYEGRDGEPRVSYWLNVSFFCNDAYTSTYDANRAEQNIHKGDIVAMVVSNKESEYNGRIYTNYNGNKFTVIKSVSSVNSDDSGQNEQTITQLHGVQKQNGFVGSNVAFFDIKECDFAESEEVMAIFN